MTVIRPAVSRDLLLPCCLQSVCVRVSHCVPFRFLDDFRILPVLLLFFATFAYIFYVGQITVFIGSLWFTVMHFIFFFSEISYYLYKVNCDRIDTAQKMIVPMFFLIMIYTFYMILLYSDGLYVFFVIH